MEYRRLGMTGMHVSVISLGAWLTFGSDDVHYKTAEACIRAAIENGINFIDVANVYSMGKAEEVVGKIVADYDRSKLVISSKAYFPMSDDINDRGLSRKNIMQSVEQSLKRLNTDYLDVFFCHRYDLNTPTEETVRALEDLIRQGKILYWGTSMWDAHQIREAFDAAKTYNAYAPAVEQPLYNMLDRHIVEGKHAQEDIVSEYGMGLVVWSPLAGGVLTGKYNDGVPEGSRADTHKADWMQDQFSEDRIEKARKMSELAEELNVTPAALALAWALNHPNVDSVITGATKKEHVEQNIKALEIEWTQELEGLVDEILDNRPVGTSRYATDPDEAPAL
jgi:voltage-dependent potassium channel beta subunit